MRGPSDDGRVREGGGGDGLDQARSRVGTVRARVVDGPHRALLRDSEAEDDPRLESGRGMMRHSGGDGAPERVDGSVAADHEAFGALLLRLPRNSDVSGPLGAGGPAAALEAPDGHSIPKSARHVEAGEASDVRCLVDRPDEPVDAAVRHIPDDGKAVHKALNQGDVQPAHRVSDGGDKGRVDASGDECDGGRHQDVDAPRDGAKSVRSEAETLELGAPPRGEGGPFFDGEADGALQVGTEGRGPQPRVRRKVEEGGGIKVGAEARLDSDAPLGGRAHEHATHRLVGGAMGASMPGVLNQAGRGAAEIRDRGPHHRLLRAREETRREERERGRRRHVEEKREQSERHVAPGSLWQGAGLLVAFVVAARNVTK